MKPSKKQRSSHFSDARFAKQFTPAKSNATSPHKVKANRKTDQKTDQRTDWSDVSDWYHEHLSEHDTYHTKVVVPNLLRILGDVKGKSILDVACGEGMIGGELLKQEAKVVGVDLGKELIALAQKNYPKGVWVHGDAQEIPQAVKETFDVVLCTLALQNIKDVKKVFAGVKQAMKPHARFLFVINHPAFRIPKLSDWQFQNDVQYRRESAYMSESTHKMDMTPSKKAEKQYTVSFHRPLQYYAKLLANEGFAITRLEEWVSHRTSEKGPRQLAEDTARKEFPLFLCIEAQ